ncbi:MAG: MnmC family methyltransferase, partial [Bacteroidota bacterium]
PLPSMQFDSRKETTALGLFCTRCILFVVLWGEQAVTLLAQRLNKGGVMVTYGAQGAFRRHLLQAGLLVERLPGPPGKREMLRAVKG